MAAEGCGNFLDEVVCYPQYSPTIMLCQSLLLMFYTFFIIGKHSG